VWLRITNRSGYVLHNNDPLGSVNGVEFLAYLGDINFSKRDGERGKELIYLEVYHIKQLEVLGRNNRLLFFNSTRVA
jgi:hypothetical protein